MQKINIIIVTLKEVTLKKGSHLVFDKRISLSLVFSGLLMHDEANYYLKILIFLFFIISLGYP